MAGQTPPVINSTIHQVRRDLKTQFKSSSDPIG
jgi:hypothetical protein